MNITQYFHYILYTLRMEYNGFSFPSTMSSTTPARVFTYFVLVCMYVGLAYKSCQVFKRQTGRLSNPGFPFLENMKAGLYVAEKSKWVCHVIVSKSSHIKRHLLTTLFMVYLWQLFYMYVIILH